MTSTTARHAAVLPPAVPSRGSRLQFAVAPMPRCLPFLFGRQILFHRPPLNSQEPIGSSTNGSPPGNFHEVVDAGRKNNCQSERGRDGYGTNFRTLKNHLWRGWLDREHRCVVPATAFSEPDENTPKGAVVWRWFERADKQPFFFAGIWRPWTGDRGTKKKPNIGDHALFSIMTTEPNSVVEPIHEKAMPVMLMTREDVDRWLRGGSLEDALAVQKPAPDDAIVIRPVEKKAA